MAGTRREQQTDEALMSRAQDDDATAFAELYDRHAARAFRVARAVCSDSGRAEEAVQEAFLAIWRNRGRYVASAGTFQAWSMRIVKNRAIDSSRAAAVRPQTLSSDGWTEPPTTDLSSDGPQEVALANGDRDELLSSLRRLPEAQATVILLAFFGELSHSEIAVELDLPPGTVKGRVRLGLEKMRRELEDPDESAEAERMLRAEVEH